MDNNKVSFKPFGLLCKDARKALGWTQKQTANRLGIEYHYYSRLENDSSAEHPSFQVFYDIVKLLNLYVDPVFHPDDRPARSMRRKQLDSLLDTMDEHELFMMLGIGQIVKRSKEVEE